MWEREGEFWNEEGCKKKWDTLKSALCDRAQILSYCSSLLGLCRRRPPDRFRGRKVM